MAKTKRDIVVELLDECGRYVPDSPNLKYYMRLGSKSFHANDTAELVDKVAAGMSMRKLREYKKGLTHDR